VRLVAAKAPPNRPSRSNSVIVGTPAETPARRLAAPKAQRILQTKSRQWTRSPDGCGAIHASMRTLCVVARTDTAGAVVFSQFFWPAALQQLTGLLADGTWVPMATVHFAAVTGALLAGWVAVRAKD
jgi:hypothetical protein